MEGLDRTVVLRRVVSRLGAADGTEEEMEASWEVGATTEGGRIRGTKGGMTRLTLRENREGDGMTSGVGAGDVLVDATGAGTGRAANP